MGNITRNWVSIVSTLAPELGSGKLLFVCLVYLGYVGNVRRDSWVLKIVEHYTGYSTQPLGERFSKGFIGSHVLLHPMVSIPRLKKCRKVVWTLWAYMALGISSSRQTDLIVSVMHSAHLTLGPL